MTMSPDATGPPATSFGAPVLVVEDTADLRQMMLWALEDEGLPAVAAKDGFEALEYARTQPPSLVVLDIGLPGMDGYQVAAALHTTYGAALPILVVTADGRAAEKARRIGAYAYLSKPFDLDDLIARVRQGLAGRDGVSADS